MWNRRQFLVRGAGAVMGASAGGLLWQAMAQEDVNQARGMITPATQDAINQGLTFLAGQQAADGSYGNGPQTGSIAITIIPTMPPAAKSNCEPKRLFMFAAWVAL